MGFPALCGSQPSSYCGCAGQALHTGDLLQITGSDFVFSFSSLRIATVPTDPGSMAQACGGDSKNPDSQAELPVLWIWGFVDFVCGV